MKGALKLRGGEKVLNGFKYARLVAGCSQDELAEKIGVTPGAISQWEAGKTSPTAKNLKKLSEVLNVPMEKLMVDELKVG